MACLCCNRFLPDETDVSTLAPALEKAVMDASGGEGASKLNFTRLNENIGALSEVCAIGFTCLSFCSQLFFVGRLACACICT